MFRRSLYTQTRHPHIVSPCVLWGKDSKPACCDFLRVRCCREWDFCSNVPSPFDLSHYPQLLNIIWGNIYTSARASTL